VYPNWELALGSVVQYYPNVSNMISCSPYDHKGSLRTTRIQLVRRPHLALALPSL
jgi:hypothetical protein